jgi:Lrp/AsnC family transcriptional regulator, leucine-responsive regulatory protein
MKLERIDKAILKALQKDGRISNAHLADKVGASTTACWNHTNRLIEGGYIRSFKAILDPNKLELSLLVLIGVVLDRSTPESFSEFEKAVKKIVVVQECLLLAGEFDYWLRVRVKDIQSFNQLHANVLLCLPGVRQLRSFFVLSEVKYSQELLIE